MKTLSTDRNVALDTLRGFAVLWMTAFHFAFDLNHFGFIHQNFYAAPQWTLQRTCILSLFLLCAGGAQALALHNGQSWRSFWRRWGQVAGCAVLVSVGSLFMFPGSWIYFGVLHGMAVMLLICRLTAAWGQWLWLAGGVCVALGAFAPQAHTLMPAMEVFNAPALNWLGWISRKPVTEDYVPVLPWLGVMWWGMAATQRALAQGWTGVAQRKSQGICAQGLAWLGRWSLTWYMVHQPVLMGLLTAVTLVRH